MVAPVNRVLRGTEIRQPEYFGTGGRFFLHMEIGECLFSQIVRIRRKRRLENGWIKRIESGTKRIDTFVDFKTTF